MVKSLSTMITPDHAAKLLSDLSYGEGSTTMEKIQYTCKQMASGKGAPLILG